MEPGATRGGVVARAVAERAVGGWEVEVRAEAVRVEVATAVAVRGVAAPVEG